MSASKNKMELIINFAKSYPPWAIILMLGCTVVFIVTAIFARAQPIPETEAPPPGISGDLKMDRNSIAGRDAVTINAGVVNLSPSPSEKAVQPLKTRIREYLRKVNPDIIRRLDSGELSLQVMIR